MALTTTASANTLEEWESAYFSEYVRESGFKPYFGAGSNMPFVYKNQLINGGQVIHIPLVTALKGSGVGTSTLEGNEEALGNYNFDCKPYWHRNAVAMNKNQMQISSIDLYKAATDMLKVWAMDDTRDSVINALGSVVTTGGYDEGVGHSQAIFYSEATAAQKNTWTVANRYRALYGDTEANYNATHATALGNVAASNDAFTAANLDLLKAMAKRRMRLSQGAAAEVPTVRPIRTGDQGREFYVAFTDSLNFRKFKADSTIAAANRDARPRDVEANPIFQDGDLVYNGVVVREIPEIPATSATVSPVYLCGAQALAQAWGQRPVSTSRSSTDYGFIKGAGVESLWSIEKMVFDSMDHGVVTGFFYTA